MGGWIGSGRGIKWGADGVLDRGVGLWGLDEVVGKIFPTVTSVC